MRIKLLKPLVAYYAADQVERPLAPIELKAGSDHAVKGRAADGTVTISVPAYVHLQKDQHGSTRMSTCIVVPIDVAPDEWEEVPTQQTIWR